MTSHCDGETRLSCSWGVIEEVTVTVWNSPVVEECFALLAEVVLDLINQLGLRCGLHDHPFNRPRRTMSRAPVEAGATMNPRTVNHCHGSAFRCAEITDVVEEVLDGRCATESGKASQGEVLRPRLVAFAGRELDKLPIFHRP